MDRHSLLLQLRTNGVLQVNRCWRQVLSHLKTRTAGSLVVSLWRAPYFHIGFSSCRVSRQRNQFLHYDWHINGHPNVSKRLANHLAGATNSYSFN